MYGYVYLITNLVNDRKYIGRHNSSKFDENYYGSGKLICQAVNKYGIENFKVEILQECDTPEELWKSEAYWIDKYNAVEDPMYYNLASGGKGGGWKSNGISIKEGIKCSPEACKRIGQAKEGTHLSAETRKLMSDHRKGSNNPFYGKTFSKEVLERFSKIRSGRIWINKDGKETQIDPDNLDQYLENGWQKGRAYKFKPYDHSSNRWMTNGTSDRLVDSSNFDKYLNEGYKFGRSFPRGYNKH